MIIVFLFIIIIWSMTPYSIIGSVLGGSPNPQSRETVPGKVGNALASLSFSGRTAIAVRRRPAAP
jgi:hypothetical protein